MDTRMGQRQSLGHCPLSHCSVEPWIPSRVCEDSVTGIPGSRDRNPSIPCRPHRCCSRCRERRSSLRSRRVCVPTRRGWAGSFPPGSAAFPRCRCSSPAPPRSRCWARSSGPCSGDRRAGTAQGTGGKKVGRREGWGSECSEPSRTYLPDVHVQHSAFAPDGAVLDVASGGESQEPQEAEGQSLAGHGGGTGGIFGCSSQPLALYL